MIPATATALLFGNLSDDGERVLLAMLTDGGQQGIEQGDGSRVRRAERVGFDAGKKGFVTNAGQRRKISIRNGDAVSSAYARVLGALYRLA